MRNRLCHFATTLALLLCLTNPVRAQGTEDATASFLPWSGWWWPAATGHHILGYRGEPGPMIKLDQLSGKHSSKWEKSQLYHFSLGGPDWWGHCHGWAAASILEPEPLRDAVQGRVRIHVGDLKALLSEAHYSDRARFFGDRYDGRPDQDLQDMSPLLVWDVLRRFIRENKLPIIFDVDAGPKVWSLPVYRYQVIFAPVGDGSFRSSITLWHASLRVHPDRVGTLPEARTYTFDFRSKDGKQPIPGSDRWTGDSIKNHPDFAWYPIERAQQNPELDYSLVTQLIRQAR